MALKPSQLLYRNIVATADSIQKLSAVPLISEISPPCTIETVPPQPFPPPVSIRNFLVKDGVPPGIAERLSDAFEDSTKTLRKRMESIFQNAWSKLLQSPRDAAMVPLTELHEHLQETHRAIFLRKVEIWRSEIHKRALSAIAAHSLVEKTESRSHIEGEGLKSFKREFVGRLEKCFEKNPLPSKADKLYLAQVSGMSYRQIHVWFQNRRSRVRKQKEIDHDPPPIAHSGSLKTGPARSNNEIITPLRLEAAASCNHDAFSTCPPLHAFPTVYPPKVDPFPCKSGDTSIFAKPSWLRSRSKYERSIAAPDMQELCIAFAELHIQDSEPSWSSETESMLESQACNKPSSYALTPPYLVVPPQAPLRSLVITLRGKLHSSTGNPQRKGTQVDVPAASGPEARNTLNRTRSCRKAKSASQATKPAAPRKPFSIHYSTASPCALPADGPPRGSKPYKKSTWSRCTDAPLERQSETNGDTPIPRAVEQMVEPLSPTPSVDSLPSLSFSSGSTSSSASTCSESPSTFVATLSDDCHSPFCGVDDCSLTIPQSSIDEYRQPTLAPDFTFDFSKGPLDFTFGQDLPSYPSYSECFDSISRGLQSSPDFAPPVLTFDLPSVAA